MSQEDGTQYRMTARQKISLYLITLFTVAGVYVIPQIPVEVWKWMIWVPLVAIGGGLLVGALAIVLALKTGQKAMGMKVEINGRDISGKHGPVTVGRWSSEEEAEIKGHAS